MEGDAPTLSVAVGEDEGVIEGVRVGEGVTEIGERDGVLEREIDFDIDCCDDGVFDAERMATTMGRGAEAFAAFATMGEDAVPLLSCSLSVVDGTIPPTSNCVVLLPLRNVAPFNVTPPVLTFGLGTDAVGTFAFALPVLAACACVVFSNLPAFLNPTALLLLFAASTRPTNVSGT